VKKFLVCLVLAVTAAACDRDGGGSPTDPSQVNIEFSTTDLVVGTGTEAVSGRRAIVLFELWLYDPAGTASKGRRIQGSTDPNPQVPGTVIGPVDFVIGSGSLIAGFDQGVRGMRVGGKRRIYIPPSLAYGSSGSQSGQIPPNASIVFEVELTNVQ
jgi:FKBP-type peptidyl-prolyl cis-trans isomerase FkpA